MPDETQRMRDALLELAARHPAASVEGDIARRGLGQPRDPAAGPAAPRAPLPRKEQLEVEDVEIQLDGARQSLHRGHYAVTIGELNGAIMILQGMDRRAEEAEKEARAHRARELLREPNAAGVHLQWTPLGGGGSRSSSGHLVRPGDLSVPGARAWLVGESGFATILQAKYHVWLLWRSEASDVPYVALR